LRNRGRAEGAGPANLTVGSGSAPPEPVGTRRLERLVAATLVTMLFERTWRIVLPLLLVAGVFVAVSWIGLWLELPDWARGLGVLGFGIAALACAIPLIRLRLPRRKDVLARIDRVSGLASRPAEVLDDRLATGANDPETEVLWALHRRRARAAIASLRTGWPSPRMAEIDRFALRGLVPVALVATSVVAGPEKLPRIAAAFDWQLAGLAQGTDRIDAWIDPPAYTGKIAVVLGLGQSGSFTNPSPSHRIEAPVGSIVIVRGSAGRPAIETTGGLTRVDQAKPAPETRAAGHMLDNEVRLRLDGDAGLTIGRAGARLGTFDLVATLDTGPQIALADVPRANARGSLVLTYKVTDDYGVVAAEAGFTDPRLDTGRKATRSLVEPPRVALALPAASGSIDEAESIADLSEHPWAGAHAILALSARDAGGNEGKSAAIEIPLPQKPFANPLAKALVEQRRNLVLAPDEKAKVATALDALALAPETFGTRAGVYLGLTVARIRLEAAETDADLLDVADHLWAMAQRIESGDLSEAERDLKAAEQALRDALARNASEKELEALTDRLRAALEAFLAELAKPDGDAGEPTPSRGNARGVDPRELLSMLDSLRERARTGDLADATRLLDQLQSILENLRSARHGEPDPRAGEMRRALDELARLGKDEQDLRDETHRRGQEAERRDEERQGARGAPRFPFRTDPGRDLGDESESDRGSEANRTDPRTDAPIDMEDLRARQKALRDRLDEIEKRLDRTRPGGSELDGAAEAMRDAEQALGRGPSSSEDAVEAQGRVLDTLRKGAQKLAEAMQGSGEGTGSGEAEAGEDGEDGAEPGRPRYGRTSGRDPLGRMTGNRRVDHSSSRFDLLGTPAGERAQRVLEELRRRLGEPARPREELDYLERLLHRY
jgi:uncharacterized protein (TIGR02302 family)